LLLTSTPNHTTSLASVPPDRLLTLPSPSIPHPRASSARDTSHDPVTVSVSLSVCLSVTSRSSTETDERIDLIFGTVNCFLGLSYAVLTISKIRVLPSENNRKFIRNSGFAMARRLSQLVNKAHRRSSSVDHTFDSQRT